MQRCILLAMNSPLRSLAGCLLFAGIISGGTLWAADPLTKWPNYSGIYPHLAMFNDAGECGTGAVVPWAGRLWDITYSPHQPNGSDLTPETGQVITGVLPLV